MPSLPGGAIGKPPAATHCRGLACGPHQQCPADSGIASRSLEAIVVWQGRQAQGDHSSWPNLQPIAPTKLTNTRIRALGRPAPKLGAVAAAEQPDTFELAGGLARRWPWWARYLACRRRCLWPTKMAWVLQAHSAGHSTESGANPPPPQPATDLRAAARFEHHTKLGYSHPPRGSDPRPSSSPTGGV